MTGSARGIRLGAVVGGMILTLGAASHAGTLVREEPGTPVADATPEAVGRYLVVLGGCNDCHTPGWAESNGELAEAGWLTGAPVGFRGPWGTSYPANLRLTAQKLSEDGWVARLQAGAGLPPMPWMNVRQMKEEDMRAVYRFIRSLGPAGTPAPMPVAPGVEPTTPYIPFEPVFPAGAGS